MIRFLPLLILAGCFGTADPEPVVAPEPPPEARADTVALRASESITVGAGETVRPDTTRPELPEGFVRLSETAPEIAQEIRYTTAFNFVGDGARDALDPRQTPR